MRRALPVSLFVAAVLVIGPVPFAGAAVGEGNAFNQLVETQASTTSAAVATASSESSSSSNSTSVIVVALIAAVALLSVIAFVIVRDARRVAPVTDAELSGRGSRDQAARLRQRRAKAKAARRQRKRNR